MKASIDSARALHLAVVEARHNSRYFDEAWLITTMSPSFYEDARELAEEYNVGVLCWESENPARSEAIWTPSERHGTRLVEDYLSRLDPDDLMQRLDGLKRCHDLALLVPSTLRLHALRQVLSNQLVESMVCRWPDAIQMSLRSSSGDARAKADRAEFARAMAGLFVDAYYYDADEDADMNSFFKSDHLFQSLTKCRDILCSAVDASLREELKRLSMVQASDMTTLKELVGLSEATEPTL